MPVGEPRGALHTALILGVVLAAVGCGSGRPGAASGPVPSSPSAAPASTALRGGGIPPLRHIVLVVFENRDVSQVMGTAAASYLNTLARGGANFTSSHAITHPSQPN